MSDIDCLRRLSKAKIKNYLATIATVEDGVGKIYNLPLSVDDQSHITLKEVRRLS